MILDGCEVDITGKDTYIKNYIDGLESELRTQFPTIRNVGEIRVSGWRVVRFYLSIYRAYSGMLKGWNYHNI